MSRYRIRSSSRTILLRGRRRDFDSSPSVPGVLLQYFRERFRNDGRRALARPL